VRPLAAVVIAAVLGAAVALGACGRSEDQQVRAVVERFADASAKKDYQRICDELIATALSKKVETIGLPCEIAFKRGLDAVQDPRIKIRSVKITGSKASVAVHSTARNQPSSDDTLALVREGGDWKIAALAGAGP
jgi:hypothetical protein